MRNRSPMVRDRPSRTPSRAGGFTRPRRLDRPAFVALLLLVAALLGGVLFTLSQPTAGRTGTNGAGFETFLASVSGGQRVCQRHELLPAGTAVVRLAVTSQYSPGPALRIELRRRGDVLARATARTDARRFFVAGRIPRTTRDVAGVTLCYTVGPGAGPVAPAGGYTSPGTDTATVDGNDVGRSMWVEYSSGAAGSWWSHASTVVRRMGMGRGDWGGPWMAWTAGALVLCAVALAIGAIWTTVVTLARGSVRRFPAVAWSVLAIGVCNALAWSLMTPPFQVPDEQTHVAYAQQIAEAGRPPVDHGRGDLAPELAGAMLATRFGWIGAPRKVPAVWSPLQERQLHYVLHAGLARHGNDDAGAADPEPPLYYALAAVPYKLGSAATLLDRMTLMRALSALLAGVTALLMFLFVRECLPGRSWAWTVGGVGAAFLPLFGFVSGGVNPDAALFPICAGLFLALARAFRHGLTMRRAVGIGIVLALGAITKINFYGLVPGAVVAVVLAARVSERGWNLRVAKLAAASVAVAIVPYALMMALDALAWDRTLILLRTPSAIHEDHGGLGGQLSYLWQVFFPRLPGQQPAFPELSPPYDLWIRGFLGRFGWVTVEYPPWAYATGAGALGAFALLAVRAMVVERAAVRRRALELVAYALMAAGLLLLIAMVALRGWAPGIQGAVQGRYVLPLLALFAVTLALSARGAGERLGRAAGVTIVSCVIAWSLFAQLLTIAYYYG